MTLRGTQTELSRSQAVYRSSNVASSVGSWRSSRGMSFQKVEIALSSSSLKSGRSRGSRLFARLLDRLGRLGEVFRVIRPGHDQDQAGVLKPLAAVGLVGREPHGDLDRPPLDLGEPGGRPGIGVELPFLLLELAGPFDERMGVILVGDLGLFELARGEPLVFLAQLGGDLGDGLLIFERQLRAAEVRR